MMCMSIQAIDSCVQQAKKDSISSRGQGGESQAFGSL